MSLRIQAALLLCLLAGCGATNNGTLQITVSGTHVTVSPSEPVTVSSGATQAFSVVADPGFVVSPTVAGTCPAGSWAGATYTTGAIVENCAVAFTAAAATAPTFSVTPTGDGFESISPSSAQMVSSGGTQTFTVTANTGYSVDTAIGGTCPSGSWSNEAYTTGPITAACTVSFSATLALPTFLVTPSGDGHESISPNSARAVTTGHTQAFTVTANTGYSVSTSVGGTCPAGSWSGATYTTGSITAACTVTFSATPATYAVTPSGDGHETISPSSPQVVSYAGTQTFTVTADTGYSLGTAVGGTCPAGSWSSGTYTTGAITAGCTVVFSATVQSFAVSAGGDGHELIQPSTVQSVNYGGTQAFSVTADVGYTLNTAVGGDCPAGSWSSNVYVTGVITTGCTVLFSATLQTFSVTPSGDGHESISPSSAQIVGYASTQSFAVTANPGYTVDTAVGGTCPAGSWFNGTYTTDLITANCTVGFSATLQSFVVTPSGDGHETISPSSPQVVSYGGTRAFTVTATAGYSVDSAVGGSCPLGSWSSGTYTTGTITAACTVSFSATAQSYTLTVTNSGDGGGAVTLNGTTCLLPSVQSYSGPAGTTVSLGATPAGDSSFGGWAGDCSGAGACNVLMDRDRSVQVTLDLKRFTVTVNMQLVRGVSGGVGATTSPPGGPDLTCVGTVCSAQYPYGTAVQLTPTGTGGALFQSWSSGCPTYAATCDTGPLTGPFTAAVTFRPPINYVFVSSVPKPANTFGSDLAVADLHCDALAKAAGLFDTTGTTPTRFKAFLSTTSTTTGISARSRLGAARGWIRVDGKEFADLTADLFNTGGTHPYQVFYPPMLTEMGTTSASYIATGSTKDGVVSTTDTCADWTSTGAAQVGDPRAGADLWTARQRNLSCTASWGLYCFETAFANPATPTPPAGARFAFLTSAGFTPGGGLSAADALCASEQGSLPGTYLALLSTSTATAASRFSTTGAPWVRPDGVQLATSVANMMSWSLLAPLDQTAAGAYATGFTNVWVGAAAPNRMATSAGNACTDWTSTAGNGQSGLSAGSSLSDNYGAASQPCTRAIQIYCLQQ